METNTSDRCAGTSRGKPDHGCKQGRVSEPVQTAAVTVCGEGFTLEDPELFNTLTLKMADWTGQSEGTFPQSNMAAQL